MTRSMVSAVPMTEKSCPRCRDLALAGLIRVETVQRLPQGAFAPWALTGGPQCYDCASAETLIRVGLIPGDIRDPQVFLMARIAVGNARQEQYRLPGAPLGLVMLGLVRPSNPGDLEQQRAWLSEQEWWNTSEEV